MSKSFEETKFHRTPANRAEFWLTYRVGSDANHDDMIRSSKETISLGTLQLILEEIRELREESNKPDKLERHRQWLAGELKNVRYAQKVHKRLCRKVGIVVAPIENDFLLGGIKSRLKRIKPNVELWYWRFSHFQERNYDHCRSYWMKLDRLKIETAKDLIKVPEFGKVTVKKIEKALIDASENKK